MVTGIRRGSPDRSCRLGKRSTDTTRGQPGREGVRGINTPAFLSSTPCCTCQCLPRAKPNKKTEGKGNRMQPIDVSVPRLRAGREGWRVDLVGQREGLQHTTSLPTMKSQSYSIHVRIVPRIHEKPGLCIIE